MCKPYFYANPLLLRTTHPQFDVEVVSCNDMPATKDMTGRALSGSLMLKGIEIEDPENEICSGEDIVLVLGCNLNVFGLRMNPCQGAIACSIDSDNHHIDGKDGI